GIPVLRATLELPVGAYLSPITAAGYLARLGDATGLDVIRAALDSELLASRMLAVKQLYFFLDLDDAARGLLEQRAQEDPEPPARARAARGPAAWASGARGGAGAGVAAQLPAAERGGVVAQACQQLDAGPAGHRAHDRLGALDAEQPAVLARLGQPVGVEQ